MHPAELFARAVDVIVDGLSLKIVSLEDLIVNKRASVRPQDLVDATYLERVRDRRHGV